MRSIKEIMKVTARADYSSRFWDAMKLDSNAENYIQNTLEGESNMYMPLESEEKFRRLVVSNSSVRRLASVFRKYDSTSTIWASDSDDYAQFVDEGDPIPGFDVTDDFSRIPVAGHKIASLAKAPYEFICDSAFDVEDYMTKRMSRSFARTEDRAFVCGTGIKEPTGLLHGTDGAVTAKTVDSISYDDCMDLFFSVKKEYRKNGVWMMNDMTALMLRKLKDGDGNYLWNQSDNTILGKHVEICDEMPDAEGGNKPLLFGDLSYYWIVDRTPVMVKALRELFAQNGQIGYLFQERLDGKLIRSDAVKVIAISDSQNV